MMLLTSSSVLKNIAAGSVKKSIGTNQVFSSPSTLDQHIRRAIKHQLHIKILKEAIYLGAPLFLTRSPIKDFKFLLDKLETKLMGWRTKCLSWVGKSTLINSMAQVVPNYSMSSFNIPAKICDNLDSTSRRFWWKPKASIGRFIAWNSWDKLC